MMLGTTNIKLKKLTPWIIYNLLGSSYLHKLTQLTIFYYDQQMHNYFTNYHTPTCFDTIVSSSGTLLSIPCQVTQVFQMQLLVIQFTIKMFHIGFMQIVIL